MEFQEGDRVDFLDDTGGGVVVAVGHNGTALVLSDEGFQASWPLTKLVKRAQKESMENLGDDRSDAFQAHLAREYEYLGRGHDPVKGSEKKRKKGEAIEAREIDLHIEELTDRGPQMTNGEIIRFQIARFEREMERAIHQRIERVVFIHGVGEGILREEIRGILRQRYDCQVFDASRARYGFGATEVLIPYYGNE